ncbi:hypothetical protein Z043_120850, partial [Scleropages formosus]
MHSVRCRANERRLEQYLMPFVKHGGRSVMLWGCLSAVQGIMNQRGYHSISLHHAIPCGQNLIGANSLMQQDNCLKYASKLCRTYSVKNRKLEYCLCTISGRPEERAGDSSSSDLPASASSLRDAQEVSLTTPAESQQQKSRQKEEVAALHPKR